MARKKTLDFGLWVHTLPKDLKQPLEPEYAYLKETADLYAFVIQTNLVWKVWQIDEQGAYWIEIVLVKNTNPEFHILKIDEGTFTKIELDKYSPPAGILS